MTHVDASSAEEVIIPASDSDPTEMGSEVVD